MASVIGNHRGSVQNAMGTFVCFAILIISRSSLVLAQETYQVKAAAPVAVPVPAPAPAPYHKPTLHELVVGALRAAGHYGAISGVIDSLNGSMIRQGITLFAPNDQALNGVPLNSSSALEDLMNFHIVTQDLPFSNLLRLNVGSRLPTAASGISILVTSTASDNYEVDNAVVTAPDLYTDANVAVHGINAVLDTAAYNKGAVAPGLAPLSSPPVLVPAAAATTPVGSPVKAPSVATKAPSPNGSGATSSCSPLPFIMLGIIAIVSLVLVSPLQL